MNINIDIAGFISKNVSLQSYCFLELMYKCYDKREMFYFFKDLSDNFKNNSTDIYQ